MLTMPVLLLSPPFVNEPAEQSAGSLALPSKLTIKRYCHGEWRLSLYPTSEVRKTRKPVIGRVVESLSIPSGSPAYLRHKPAPPPVKTMHQMSIDYPRTLDYRSEVQGISESKPKCFRLPSQKCFRNSGRIRIQECASIAERRFGNNALFFTGTIPGSGWRIAAEIAAYSGKIVNRVKQWFRDNLTDTYSCFSVWEWQKRGMLHLHLCLASNETTKLEKLRASLKERWILLLQDISWDCKRDLFRKNASWTWQDDLSTVQADAQWVKKSIARYLSKYSCKVTNGCKRPRFFSPTRWWSVDRATQQQADRERALLVIQGFTGQVGFEILSGIRSLFESQKAHIKPFRNFCWTDFGGINLFEDGKNLLELVQNFVADNYGDWNYKGGNLASY